MVKRTGDDASSVCDGPSQLRSSPLPVWDLLCLSAAPGMDKTTEMDNLEMRLRALESRIYGERKNKSGKPVKVRLYYVYLYIC